MGFFAQQGKGLKASEVQLTFGSIGPKTLFSAQADEWIDIYSITITSNDTALQTVTLDDGTNTINVYYVGGVGTLSPVLSVLDSATIPFRTKVKGGSIRATAGAVTNSAGVAINVQVHATVSKT